MLRCAFHTCPAERCKNTLFQLSNAPGGYGTVMVNEWMTTVRSRSCAALQMGSHSGASSDSSGGQIGKIPTGHGASAQRRISATDAAASRGETSSRLVRRSGYGAQ